MPYPCLELVVIGRSRDATESRGISRAPDNCIFSKIGELGIGALALALSRPHVASTLPVRTSRPTDVSLKHMNPGQSIMELAN